MNGEIRMSQIPNPQNNQLQPQGQTPYQSGPQGQMPYQSQPQGQMPYQSQLYNSLLRLNILINRDIIRLQ